MPSYIIQAAQPVFLNGGGLSATSSTQSYFTNDYQIPYSTMAIIKVLTRSTTQVYMKYNASSSGETIIGLVNNGFPLLKNSWNEFTFYVETGDKVNFYSANSAEMQVLLFASAPDGSGGSI